jgi:hypothetical protein
VHLQMKRAEARMLTNVYAEEPVDSVSIPFTSTIFKTPALLSWGF